ncbi:hypothetical protein ACET3Z_012325 [Daucus carota]
MYALSDAPCVLRNVSLYKYDHFAQTLNGQIFLERCTMAENPEALYQTGMIQHFKEETAYGMDCLNKAMTCGHLDATYAVGMILILKGGESKNNGMQMIYDLKKINCTKTKFEEIRQKFLRRLLWIKNTFLVGREMPICCKNHKMKDSDAPCVLRHVSLYKFDHFALTLNGQTFLERCTIAENPEALYRTGMIQHFKEKTAFGMDCLHGAMTCGHLDVTYAVGMILILKGSEAKNNRMQIIFDIKKINCTRDQI